MNKNPEYSALLINAAIKLELFPDNKRLLEAYETANTAFEMIEESVFLEDSFNELRDALLECLDE